jgi:hypothetical protein
MPRAHYMFAVEAVDVLRRVGPIILKYTLRAYDGQLSRLVFALRHWAESNGRKLRPDAALVEEYISDAFGARHHLTSLFRYALCANETSAAERVSLAGSHPTAFDPHQPYQCGSHIRVLPDLHDCQRLVELISHDANGSCLLDESEAGERGVYLMSVAGGTAEGYRIDPGVEVMLSFFEHPRSCSEVAELLLEIGGVPGIGASYFEPLVDAGILVASPHTTAAAQAS